MFSKIRKYFRDPQYHFGVNNYCGMYRFLPDAVFLKKRYYASFRKKLDLDNPITFNEKLQWLKLHNRQAVYSVMVDKYLVKEYVADKIGQGYVVPTLGVWDRFEDIDFSTLPQQFVLKCTHDSGGICICKNKVDFNIEDAKKKISRSLKHNYYYNGREWPYKDVKPRIIAEQYLANSENNDTPINDYKFFCFNGAVKFFKIDFDRFTNHKANYYTIDGQLLPFGEVVCPPDFSKKLDMPDHLNEMVELAERLSTDIPFLRVDFYEVSGHVYFGEMTFFPDSGFGPFTDEKWDLTLGSWIQLQ